MTSKRSGTFQQCSIEPNGKALSDVIERWKGRAEFDDGFATNVAAAHDLDAVGADADPWQD